MGRRIRGPLVSVIVPACNSEGFIRETLGSIQAQTFQDWECVIVDDASTDKTRAEVEGFIGGDERFRFFSLPFRVGVSSARNRGFLESCRETAFVCFMDSDDRWFPDSLQRLVKGIERRPDSVGIHGLGEFIGMGGELIAPGAFQRFGRRRLGFLDGEIQVWPTSEASCFASLCWSGTVYPPGVLLTRRKGYERVGLFDEGLRFSEDWDMVIRLSRMGAIGFLNEEVVQYRRHPGNATQDHTANSRGARSVHLKTFFSAQNRSVHRRVLRVGWRAWERFKLREKVQMAWRGMVERDWGGASRGVLAAPVHALRYVSGYPELNLF
jgi:glycosyltransferase involved in cell wall biosynthesis